MKKDIFTGMFVGLMANAIGLFLAANFLGRGDDFMVVIEAAAKEGFLGKLISLGAILNLIAFFIFIKKTNRLELETSVLSFFIFYLLFVRPIFQIHILFFVFFPHVFFHMLLYTCFFSAFRPGFNAHCIIISNSS